MRLDARALGIVSLSLAVVFVVAFFAPTVRAGYTDFLSFYAGARLVGTPELYSYSRVQEIQREYSRNPGEVRAYIRLPFYALLLSPLGSLEYESAQRVWQALNFIAFVSFLWLWCDRALFIVLCCWYFPTWVSFALAHDVPIILLIFAVSFHLCRRQYPLLAGMVFALCSIKFHLFLLAPVFILGLRAWRFSVGLLAGGTVLLAISFAAGGADWPRQYLLLLTANEAGQDSYGNMANLAGLLTRCGWGYGTVLAAILCVVIAVTFYLAVRRVPLRLGFSLLAAAGLVVSPHAFLSDCMLLIPAFTAFAQHQEANPNRYVIGLMTVGVASLMLTQPSVSWIAQLIVVAAVFWLLTGALGARSPGQGKFILFGWRRAERQP